MWVCPSCGAVKIGFTDDKCQTCECDIIDTGLDWNDFINSAKRRTTAEHNAWIRELSEKYAPNATQEARQKRYEYDNAPSRIPPKCPMCGGSSRHVTNIEATYNPALHHSNTVGKTFVCEHCGYAW